MLESDRFKGKNYYEVLGVAESATKKQIRVAYLKLAVETHPDKSSSPDAAKEFQDLGKVYKCLSDAESRAFYDSTKQDNDMANWDDMSDDQKFDAVMTLFNTSRFDEQDIAAHVLAEEQERTSSHSGLTEFEKQEVITFYNKHNGKWSLISQCVPGEGKAMLQKYKTFILEKIQAGEVEDFGTTKVPSKAAGSKRRGGPSKKKKRRS
ncbi:hypothetical protein P9112_013125 [Eukaryota sp. TZLM1-RC]